MSDTIQRQALQLDKPFTFKADGLKLSRSFETKKSLKGKGFSIPTMDYSSFIVSERFQKRVFLNLKRTDKTLSYVVGESGTGKDYCIEGYCSLTNTPIVCVNGSPTSDLNDAIASQALKADKNGNVISVIELEMLAKACQYDKPIVILFSDLDRMNNESLEALRQSFQVQGSRYFTNPITKEMIEISKSVKMIATGNSFIDGTLEGMNGTPLEKSIANRFTAFIKASRPSLETLEKIAVSSRKKGDTVLNGDDAKKVALFIHKLQAIKDMPFEFSIRTLKNFISSIESYVEDMDLLDAYDMAHDDIKNSFGDDANVAVYEGVKDTLYGSSWISRFSNK